jgi:hypothetical protein
MMLSPSSAKTSFTGMGLRPTGWRMTTSEYFVAPAVVVERPDEIPSTGVVVTAST